MDEKWDLVVNKFILNLPNVSKDLRLLSIRHDPPLNGKGIDTVDGNLLRRKKLYEKVLPKLTSLETIIAPTVLQSITSYEMYACDLLWNGCKCAFCSKYLPLFDKYIMNHQYFSTPDARYLDIIPIVFAAYTGKSLAKRFDPQKNWDLVYYSMPLRIRRGISMALREFITLQVMNVILTNPHLSP